MNSVLMQNKLFRIEKIVLKDLLAFSLWASNHLAFKDALPISPARTVSQINNPYGDPDDIALLVAYYGQRCVGYFGLMPGLLYHHGHYSKIYYASTFFVSPEMRSKGLGYLILKELKNLKIDIVLTGMTKSAKRIYDRIGFKELGNLTHYQLRINRINLLNAFFSNRSSTLTKSYDKPARIFSLLNRAENLIYGLSKKVFYIWLINLDKITERQLYYKEVKQIKAELFSSKSLKSPYGFVRECRIVNWMLKYPWILSSSEGKNTVRNYFFSSVREFFKYIALEIFSADRKTVKGFLVISVSRHKGKTVIKVLDFSIHPDDIELVGFLILTYAKKFLADLVEYPVEIENYFRKKQLFGPLIKKRKRLYLFQPKSDESPLAAAAGNIVLTYCDSDTAFT